MTSYQPHDMYYDNPPSRSPESRRPHQPTLHRQSSRHFDTYAHLPSGLYAAEDPSARYDPPRFDRMNATVHPGYTYNMPGAQTWNPSAFDGANTFVGFGATGRVKPSSRGRTALPTTWLDAPQGLPTVSPFSALSASSLGSSGFRPDMSSSEPDEELIPTAIVIKNIPFAVKKEQLVQLMTDMNLPLPYAFNYHFDNGVFRGLAFANFTTPDETAAVIEHLNHFELQGRKLRVEYKKMLPLAERERIEREKRERRGQLEEQHRPMPTAQLQNQHSMSSMSSHIPATSPSPVSQRSAKPEVDLNDPQTLQYYSQMLLFKDDLSREALIFPSNLTPPQRRIVHTLAHHMGLSHVSRGNGESRQVHVFRAPPGANMSPPMPQIPTTHASDSRRGLNRAATIDFSEARGSDPGLYGSLARQSSGLLGIPGSPGGGLANLRAAKSFADLRSYTPSPVPSTASFPAALGGGLGSRYAEYNQGSLASNTPSLTPTATSGGMSSTTRDRDEATLLVNGLGGMSLGGPASGFGRNTTRQQELRGMVSWESDTSPHPSGPIGSNRNFGISYDDQQSQGSQQHSPRERGRDGMPLRQPRGPTGTGFGGVQSRGRTNGQMGNRRDSGDMNGDVQSQSGVEIVVE